MPLMAARGMSYDVFISYHESDKEWVTGQLLKHLEDEAFSVCWDDRDFEPGKTIIENKLNSLCSSACTVVVLTPNYGADEDLWSTLIDKCHVDSQEIIREFNLVPILLRQCKVSDLFAPLWKLDWTNKVAQKFFWKKLIQTVKKITDKQHNKGFSECTTDSATGKTIYGGKSNNDKNTECASIVSGTDDTPKERNSLHGDMQRATKALQNGNGIGNTCDESGIKGSYENKENICNGKESFVLNNNEIDCDLGKSKSGRRNNTMSALADDSSEGEYQSKLKSVHSSKGDGRSTVVLYDSDAAEYDDNLNSIPSRPSFDANNPVDTCILSDQDPENSYDDEESRLLEKLDPRIIGLFVPEDDDLTRQDIEELTLKIEDVCVDDVDSGILVETEMMRPDTTYTKKMHPLEMEKNSDFNRFNSQQEQMLVLDSLQGQEMLIRKRFENCTASERKKTYRRLLERFDKAICSTVNGYKNSNLLASLPTSGISEIEHRGCNCSCCDQMFHSERALHLHMVDCVNRAWKSILANETVR